MNPVIQSDLEHSLKVMYILQAQISTKLLITCKPALINCYSLRNTSK